MDELWRVLRSPKVSTLMFLGTLVVLGLAVIFLGYRAIAAEVYAPAQTPYLVSGSLVGIALVGTGLRLLAIHVDRVEAALERRQLSALQDEALAVLESRHVPRPD